MTLRILGVCFGLVALSLVAAEPPASGTAANEKLEIQATVYNDKAAIRGVLGEELDSGIVVVEVRLTPKGGDSLKVWRDDFTLRSDRDGQKSGPFDPSQIAGNSVITLVRTYSAEGVLVEDSGPVWGGVGGTRPRRMPGPAGGVGNATTGQETNEARVGPSRDDPDSPLLAALKAKILTEEEISAPVAGLLYFPMDGKHKIKQLELHYRGQAGPLDLRFKKPK
jgi:hypothetical protein